MSLQCYGQEHWARCCGCIKQAKTSPSPAQEVYTPVPCVTIAKWSKDINCWRFWSTAHCELLYCDWSFEQELLVSEREGERTSTKLWIMQHQSGVGHHAAGVSEFEHLRDRGWSSSWRSWVATESFEETDNMMQTKFKEVEKVKLYR